MFKNTTRIISFMLLFALMISVFAGCKGNEGVQQSAGDSSNGSVKLWYAYNTENLMQDLEYQELMAERDATLRMHCIRNDVESIQLMITPSVDVLNYDFEMGNLKNENGDVLSAASFDLFAEKYIEITASYNNDAYYGYYSDALIPFEKSKAAYENYISAGKNQGLWIQANIPAEQAAGFYTGNGTLVLDGVSYEIPFEVTVYDATMPAENHVTSTFAIWYELISMGEGYYTDELAEAYYDFLASKRITPMKPIYSLWTLNNVDAYVEWMVEQAQDPMITSYCLPYDAEQYELGTVVSRSGVVKMLSAIAEKNIELRQAGNTEINLFDKAIYYLGSICDEPAGEKLQVTRDCDLIITECKKEVAEKYLKDQYPDLYESCMKVPHVVTAAYNGEMEGSDTVGGIQTWCGQFQTWHSESQRQDYYDRRDNSEREYGEGLWWYGCTYPRTPFPNYHTDDDTISARIIPWMMFEYDVEGMLYWVVNYYKSGDIWNIPFAWEDAVGDGNLMYPGAKYGIFGPISTRRLENIREGNEDYECLLLLENAILAYNEANGTNYEPKELMSWIYADLYEGVIPERDNAEGFAQQRVAMLEVLEQFTTDPTVAIEMLQNG